MTDPHVPGTAHTHEHDHGHAHDHDHVHEMSKDNLYS